VPLVVGVFVYAVLFIALLPHFRYQLNPDGVSYLSVANKYFLHDWKNAINGYWGPLYSWFLAVGLNFLQDKLLVAKIVNGIIGAFGLVIFSLIICRYNLPKYLSLVFNSIAAIWLSYFALVVITPDLLIVTLLLLFIFLLVKVSDFSKYSQIVVIALVGTLLYLTKSFYLFFVPVIFIVFAFIQSIHNSKLRKQIVKGSVLFLIFFVLFSSIWSLILSTKYNRFTFGTSGKYNIALIGPGGMHPTLTLGLLPVSDVDAVSSWDDPTTLSMAKWSPLQSKSSLGFYLGRVHENIDYLYQLISKFWPMAIAILIFGFAVAIKRKESILAFFTLSIFALFAAYALILPEERYVWVAIFLLMLIVAELWSNLGMTNYFKNHLGILVSALMLVTAVIFPLDMLRSLKDVGRSDWLLVGEINRVADFSGKKIASNGSWNQNLSITSQIDGKYLGKVSDVVNGKDIVDEQFREQQPDYYFYWPAHDIPLGGKTYPKNVSKVLAATVRSGNDLLEIYKLSY